MAHLPSLTVQQTAPVAKRAAQEVAVEHLREVHGLMSSVELLAKAVRVAREERTGRQHG